MSENSTKSQTVSGDGGFTLVELLVVIGVISILFGLLLPSLLGARKAANGIVCMNNMRMLGLGMQIYAAESKGIIPWEGYAEGDRAERHVGPWEEPSVWFNACPKYARYPQYCDQQLLEIAGKGTLPRSGDKSIFVCPDAGEPSPGPADDVVVDGYFLMWGLDTAGVAVQRKTYWCYGYNTQLDGGVEDRHVDYRVTISLARIKRASETIVLAEKIMRPKELTPPFNSGCGQQEVSYREFTTRHKGGGYLLFMDSHVGYFTRREVLSAPKAPYDYNQPGKLIWNPKGAGL